MRRLVNISIAFASVMPVIQIVKTFRKTLSDSEKNHVISKDKQWKIAKIFRDKYIEIQ